MNVVNLAIVEDNPRFRESLARMLNETPEFQCEQIYVDAEEALAGIAAAPPQVVLMDIHLPGMNGVECVRRLNALVPQVRVIMLTVYEDTDTIFAALKAGASGYILKRTTPDRLREAIRDVVDGGAPMSGAIARKVVQSFQEIPPAGKPLENLSSREKEVLDMLARGFLYKEISDQLQLSLSTVKTYVRRIYEKLHVQSRTEAVVKYLGQEKEGTSSAQQRTSNTE